MTDPAPDQYEVDDEGEGPDEDLIPFEDTPAPLPKKIWACVGVNADKLKRLGDPHPLDFGSKPDQGTTDASGRYMSGHCPSCGERTIWKEAKLG